MTDNERRRIYGMSKQMGMSSEELHLLVCGVTGCDSLKALDIKQTAAVISELSSRMKLSGEKPRKKQQRENIAGMITQRQQDYCWSMIYRLAELYPSDKTEGERMCGAIHKLLGITADVKEPFRWVSFEQGRDLIEGLKRYVESSERKALREGRKL